MGTMVTRVVKFIRKGIAGKDAVSIIVTPETIVLKKSSQPQVAFVKVGLFLGDTVVEYGGGPDQYLCSTLGTGGEVVPGKLKWSFITNDPDYRFAYGFILLGNQDVDIDIPFTITYKGIIYKKNIRFTTIVNGEGGKPGDPGPSLPPLRGPQDWESLPTGYNLYAGEVGDPYKDVVIYRGNYYSCNKSHTKERDMYPGGPQDIAYNYWQLSDKLEMVATKILLATYALVKNLGVETIEMKDGAGNVQFMAKDGEVICNTGTFHNIEASGKVNLHEMYLGPCSGAGLGEYLLADGALIFGPAQHLLPPVPDGMYRCIRWVNPLKSRTTVQSLFRAMDGNIYIHTENSGGAPGFVKEVQIQGYGVFELIGYGNKGRTEWYISEIEQKQV